MDIAAELQDPRFLKMLSGFKKGDVNPVEESSDESEGEEEADALPPAKKRSKERPILLKDIPRDQVKLTYAAPLDFIIEFVQVRK